MSKKFFTTESLATLVNEIKAYVANAISTKADSSHSHSIADVDSLQNTLNAKAAQSSLDSHISDADKHITSTERTNWNAAKTTADAAQTKANSAYTLAESKVDSLSDLGITATANELNYCDGVTSNIQTQLDNKAASSHGVHVPSCSASNNGQFLRVVGGTASWSTVPNAEEATF